MIEISITRRQFELYFDVSIALGPSRVEATGFAGRLRAERASNGIVLRLAVSLDVNIIEIIKIKASGELRLNTHGHRPQTLAASSSIQPASGSSCTGKLSCSRSSRSTPRS